MRFRPYGTDAHLPVLGKRDGEDLRVILVVCDGMPEESEEEEERTRMNKGRRRQTKFERLKDLSTDNMVLRRDWDDKTWVLESNGGGLLQGPPQALSSQALKLQSATVGSRLQNGYLSLHMLGCVAAGSTTIREMKNIDTQRTNNC